MLVGQAYGVIVVGPPGVVAGDDAPVMMRLLLAQFFQQ